jgi:glycosyltransferase 2 family protein
MKKSSMVRLGWLLLGILVLLFFIDYMGANGLLLILSRISPIAIVLLVFVELVGFLMYGTTWYVLIRSSGHRIKFSMCQEITFASVFISFLTSSGFILESMRVVLGSKEAEMHTGESASTVILHRVAYIITVLVSTVTAMLALSAKGWLPHAEAVQLELASGILIIIILVGVFLSLSPRFIQPLRSVTVRIIRPITVHLQRLQEHDPSWTVERFLTDYENTFRKLLSNRRDMLLTFLSSSGDWSCSIILLWGILGALGHVASVWIVVIAMAVGEMVEIIPIPIPGMLGIYETSITATLLTFNVPGPISASAVILLRLVTSVFDIPATGYAAYRYGYGVLMNKLSGSPRPTSSMN